MENICWRSYWKEVECLLSLNGKLHIKKTFSRKKNIYVSNDRCETRRLVEKLFEFYRIVEEYILES